MKANDAEKLKEVFPSSVYATEEIGLFFTREFTHMEY